MRSSYEDYSMVLCTYNKNVIVGLVLCLSRSIKYISS